MSFSLLSVVAIISQHIVVTCKSRYIYCKSIFYDGSSLEVNDRHHFTIRGMIHGGMQVVCMRADSVHELQWCNFSSAGNQLSRNLPLFNRTYKSYSAIINLKFGLTWKISMSTILIDKVFSLVETCLADVYRLKGCFRNTFSRVSPPPLTIWETFFIVMTHHV